MAQAILVAIIAGVATALMSGLLTPGVAPVIFLSLLAPAPLFIAGLGWHPLVAALGGLIAGLVVNLATGSPAALMVTGMFALPAFALTLLGERLFSEDAGRPDKDGVDLGRLAVTLVLYVGIAGVAATMLVEPDFAALQARIRRAVEVVFAMAMPGYKPAPAGGQPADLARVLDFITGIMLPVSALIAIATTIMSGALALQIVERAGRLAFNRPDLRRFRLPGGALILMGLAFLVGIRTGYVGLLGEIVAVGLAFAYMLQGLAVVHARTTGTGGRGLILVASWASIVILSFPALIFIAIGMADHLMDFRRRAAR